MGKVLFSIVLVAAAFAGGAAINGPGLRWVQAKVGLLAAGEEDGAATDKDPNPSPNPPAAGSLVSMGEAPSALPVVPMPTMTKAPDVATAPVPEPKAPAPPDVTPLSLDEPPKPAPAPEVPSPGLPRLEPPAAKDEPRAAKPPESEPGPPWSDMPGSAPAAAVGPRPQARANPDLEPMPPSGSGSGSEPRPAPATAGDWAELRSKMRALGVARYGIEGEPGGRVRFHCLIPLAGRRAVGQQFEAEGSDEIQAAQAALRRVALWRATEGEHAAPPRPAD